MAQVLTGNEVLAIDAGTQGISLILWCSERKELLGIGEASYAHPYIPDLPHGRLEQYAHYWSDAMSSAMIDLRSYVQKTHQADIVTVAAIGVTGHMHCMVRRTSEGKKPFGCDMWNDPRGTSEGEELTRLFDEHIPSRWTGNHILASMRNDPAEWTDVQGVNVTSGSLVHDLTGEWVLGPGDASGMFGILGEDGQIDPAKLDTIDHAAGNTGKPLREMVPRIVPAGEVAGRLNATGSTLLGGLPEGIPVAAPEGDQQSVLIGAAADELEVALSAGTSFTGNVPSKAHIKADSETINVLHTPDNMTMLMVCARNGTVGFSEYTSGLAKLSGTTFAEMADRLTDLAVELPKDVYDISLLPFFQGENVADLPDAKAEMHHLGINYLSNPGIMAQLLLEGPCMTMKYGLEKMEPKAGKVRKIILSGGALKSKNGYAPQLYANILGIPVSARIGDEEGTAKGAATLAAYMVQIQAGNTSQSLAVFAKSQATGEEQTWEPDPAHRDVYDARYAQFLSLVEQAQQNAS